MNNSQAPRRPLGAPERTAAAISHAISSGHRPRTTEDKLDELADSNLVLSANVNTLVGEAYENKRDIAELQAKQAATEGRLRGMEDWRAEMQRALAREQV
jgi:hypothetical protein